MQVPPVIVLSQVYPIGEHEKMAVNVLAMQVAAITKPTTYDSAVNRRIRAVNTRI